MPLNDVTNAAVGVFDQQTQQQQHDLTNNPASIETEEIAFRSKIQQQQQRSRSPPSTPSPEPKLNGTTQRLLAALAGDDDAEIQSLQSPVKQPVSGEHHSGARPMANSASQRPTDEAPADDTHKNTATPFAENTDKQNGVTLAGQTGSSTTTAKNSLTAGSIGTTTIESRDTPVGESPSPSSKENSAPVHSGLPSSAGKSIDNDHSEQRATRSIDRNSVRNVEVGSGLKSRPASSPRGKNKDKRRGSPRSSASTGTITPTRHRKHLPPGVLPRMVLSPKSRSLVSSPSSPATPRRSSVRSGSGSPSSSRSQQHKSSSRASNQTNEIPTTTTTTTADNAATAASSSHRPESSSLEQRDRQREGGQTVSNLQPSSSAETRTAAANKAIAPASHLPAANASNGPVPARRLPKRVRFSSELSSARLFMGNETPQTIATTPPLRPSELRRVVAEQKHGVSAVVSQTSTRPRVNSNSQDAQRDAALGVIRWGLLIGLWVIAIVDPHVIMRVFERLRTGGVVSSAVVPISSTANGQGIQPVEDRNPRQAQAQAHGDVSSNKGTNKDEELDILMKRKLQWERFLQEYPYPPPPPQYMYAAPQYHPHYQVPQPPYHHHPPHPAAAAAAAVPQEQAPLSHDPHGATENSPHQPRQDSNSIASVARGNVPLANVDVGARKQGGNQPDEARLNSGRVQGKGKTQRGRVPSGPASVAIAWPVRGALVFGQRVDVRVEHTNLDIKRFALHRGAKVCLSLRSGAHHEMVGCVMLREDDEEDNNTDGVEILPKQFTDVKLDNLVDGEYELSAILLSDVRKLARAVTKFEVRLLQDPEQASSSRTPANQGQGVRVSAGHARTSDHTEGNARHNKRAAAAGTVGRNGGRIAERHGDAGRPGALGHMAVAAQGMGASAAKSAKVATAPASVGQVHSEVVHTREPQQTKCETTCTTTYAG
jgi:hypothetical protein